MNKRGEEDIILGTNCGKIRKKRLKRRFFYPKMVFLVLTKDYDVGYYINTVGNCGKLWGKLRNLGIN